MNSFVALMLTFRFSCNTYLSVCLSLPKSKAKSLPPVILRSIAFSSSWAFNIYFSFSFALSQLKHFKGLLEHFSCCWLGGTFDLLIFAFISVHFCSLDTKKSWNRKITFFCFWTNEWNPICDVIQWSWSRGWLNANGLAQSKMKWMPPYISQSKWPGLDGFIVSRSMQSSISTVIVLTLKWLATLLFSLGR